MSAQKPREDKICEFTISADCSGRFSVPFSGTGGWFFVSATTTKLTARTSNRTLKNFAKHRLWQYLFFHRPVSEQKRLRRTA
jgi:hypothetical protein